MSSNSLQYDDTRFSQLDGHETSMVANFDNCPTTDKSEIELEQQLSDVEEYDPRIRQHLEELNRFATKINQLEKCFEVFWWFYLII